MSPNFETGDYLIVDEISYRLASPQRGDVIVFNFPKDTKERFIKRVIGLPGETVDITNGQVEIIKDGKTTNLAEKYLPVLHERDSSLKPISLIALFSTCKHCF